VVRPAKKSRIGFLPKYTTIAAMMPEIDQPRQPVAHERHGFMTALGPFRGEGNRSEQHNARLAGYNLYCFFKVCHVECPWTQNSKPAN